MTYKPNRPEMSIDLMLNTFEKLDDWCLINQIEVTLKIIGGAALFLHTKGLNIDFRPTEDIDTAHIQISNPSYIQDKSY